MFPSPTKLPFWACVHWKKKKRPFAEFCVLCYNKLMGGRWRWRKGRSPEAFRFEPQREGFCMLTCMSILGQGLSGAARVGWGWAWPRRHRLCSPSSLHWTPPACWAWRTMRTAAGWHWRLVLRCILQNITKNNKIKLREIIRQHLLPDLAVVEQLKKRFDCEEVETQWQQGCAPFMLMYRLIFLVMAAVFFLSQIKDKNYTSEN